MEMLSIKDFAKEQGVSYEAIRKQVKKFAEDLEGHISTQGKTKYLDEYARKFLSEKRRERPVVVLQQNINTELEELKLENEKLQKILLQAQEKIIALQEDSIKAIESNAKYELLLETSERTNTYLQETAQALSLTKTELQDKEEEIRALKDEIYSLKAEANSYQRSIFGLYKKVSK